MFDTFSTALSAFSANSAAIAVTGDNLANLNTTGYKASRAAFHDLVSGNVSEDLQISVGVTASSERVFTQGSFNNTGRNLDAAIQGSGFFVIRDANDTQLFTRTGNFKVDADGLLTTSTGERVQGWPALSGVVANNGPLGDLMVPTGGLLAPEATTEMSLQLNLDETQPVGATFSVLSAAIDSLGETHNVTVTFTKASATDWDYEVTVPGDDISAGTPGTPYSITTGTLSFGPDGRLVAGTTTVAVDITGLNNAANDINVVWNLFDSAGTESFLTHFAQTSGLSSISQDGVPAAELIDLRMDEGGFVVARYTRGVELTVGQIALANVSNPDSLVAVGNNAYRTSSSTADPAIGQPASGGRGQIRGGALESSTVDLAQEFTNLIRFQRSYQANSRMITTQDEVIQETLNLKR